MSEKVIECQNYLLKIWKAKKLINVRPSQNKRTPKRKLHPSLSNDPNYGQPLKKRDPANRWVLQFKNCVWSWKFFFCIELLMVQIVTTTKLVPFSPISARSKLRRIVFTKIMGPLERQLGLSMHHPTLCLTLKMSSQPMAPKGSSPWSCQIRS